MTSTALPIRNRQRARLAAIGSAVAVLFALGVAPGHAEGAERAAETEPEMAAEMATETLHPFADRFPNVVLQTHEGKNVRFYDDLLRGKIVLINFMYATCTER